MSEVVVMALSFDEDTGVLSVECNEDLAGGIVEQLGYLEWAKAICLKSLEIENVLDRYNEDEEC